MTGRGPPTSPATWLGSTSRKRAPSLKGRLGLDLPIGRRSERTTYLNTIHLYISTSGNADSGIAGGSCRRSSRASDGERPDDTRGGRQRFIFFPRRLEQLERFSPVTWYEDTQSFYQSAEWLSSLASLLVDLKAASITESSLTFLADSWRFCGPTHRRPQKLDVEHGQGGVRARSISGVILRSHRVSSASDDHCELHPSLTLGDSPPHQTPHHPRTHPAD